MTSGEPQYTTGGLLQAERGLLTAPTRGAAFRSGVAAPRRGAPSSSSASPPGLSDEQCALVAALTRSGDGVQVVLAAGGTGKTFALEAAVEAWGRSGIAVLGCALSARATCELRDRAGLDATTIASLMNAPDHGASEWLEARRSELRASSIADYTWQPSNHLLPFFHRHRLPQITVAEVDRYREYKVHEGVLSAVSINKTITRLGQILAVAEERDLIPRNPVRVNTRNRKLKAKRKRPVYLDSAEQIVAMIDAAAELDAKPQARTAGRRALIATLVYAGLRIGEATALRWRDVDLANGRICVGDAKTEAGIRLVDILPALRDELTSHRHAAAERSQTARLPTSTGSRRDKDNARERVIRPVVAHADELLAERGQPGPLPGRRDRPQATPHLRLDPLRPRRGSALRDGATRAHGRGLHTPRLRPRDAPRRRRQGAPQGARRGP